MSTPIGLSHVVPRQNEDWWRKATKQIDASQRTGFNSNFRSLSLMVMETKKLVSLRVLMEDPKLWEFVGALLQALGLRQVEGLV